MSFLKRLFGGGKPDSSAPQQAEATLDTLPPETASDASDPAGGVRDYMRREIAAAYLSREDIIRQAIEYVDGDMGEEEASALVHQLWPDLVAHHRAAQQHWPRLTDSDRLDAAFDTMETRGIIARQNFTCCGTCGSAEIWDEIAGAQEKGAVVRGYTFFHWQDTEGAVDGGGLYLNYGSVEDGEEAALGIAREIVEVLDGHGLTSDWDGSWNRRIGVLMDWQRRREYPA